MEIATLKSRIHTNDANSAKREIIYPELSYKLTGIFFEIQKELGRFCRERQYADALEQKLKQGNINYEREKNIENDLIKGNRADFIIDKKILVELKSIPFTTKLDYFQVMRYLKASNLKLGMIVNFQSRYLKPKRIINNEFATFV